MPLASDLAVSYLQRGPMSQSGYMQNFLTGTNVRSVEEMSINKANSLTHRNTLILGSPANPELHDRSLRSVVIN